MGARVWSELVRVGERGPRSCSGPTGEWCVASNQEGRELWEAHHPAKVGEGDLTHLGFDARASDPCNEQPGWLSMAAMRIATAQLETTRSEADTFGWPGTLPLGSEEACTQLDPRWVVAAMCWPGWRRSVPLGSEHTGDTARKGGLSCSKAVPLFSEPLPFLAV